MAGCFPSIFGSKSSRNRRLAANANPNSSRVEENQLNAAKAATQCCSSPHTDLFKFDKPPAYTPASAKDIYRPEVLDFISKRVNNDSDELRKLSLKIHDNPEIQFEEVFAHDTMSDFMESHGFEVTRHYLADELMNTAWKAEYSHGEGGRVIGINSEMDALPGIGHACGHNLIGICGVGVALAIKAALKKFDIPGKIVLLGTPAEEGGGGKVLLIERGGYKGMDACVMSHPGPGPDNMTAFGSSLAIESIDVEYFGHTAHASMAPWEGRNALDAAVVAYSSVAVLRQQIHPDFRVHGIIEGKDWAPNVIPDYARMEWIVRASTAEEARVLRKRVENCLEAAALATACEVKISTPNPPYNDLRNSPVLAQNYEDVCGQGLGMLVVHLPEPTGIGGSTDFGNVTYEMPAIHPVYTIPTEPGGGNHTTLFTASARTVEAHEMTLKVTKGLAHTGFRVLDDDKFYQEMKDAFESSNSVKK